MFRDVIRRGCTRKEWDKIRQETRGRIVATLGQAPPLRFRRRMQCIRDYEDLGLHMKHIRLTAVPDYATYGALIYPPAFKPRKKYPAALVIHGPNVKTGHRSVLMPGSNQQYAVELARRGWVTLAVDQFGFGEGNEGRSAAQMAERFYGRYPNWSLDGVRLWVQQCALDVLTSQSFVNPDRIACVGLSTGGRCVLYLTALDDRIKAAVSAAGLSPNLTNIYRNRPHKNSLSPVLDLMTSYTGQPPFEYQELLSLIAPRSVLLIEPWNDLYNPMVEPIFECFTKARFVFQLCDATNNLQILCHGDGHTTLKHMREYAYAWLEERI
ncbi:MAG: hypothetical protein GXY38_02270 [Planctomycetes bacterium]|nr:hypothetical protein [Planctomycetota bacterium]